MEIKGCVFPEYLDRIQEKKISNLQTIQLLRIFLFCLIMIRCLAEKPHHMNNMGMYIDQHNIEKNIILSSFVANCTLLLVQLTRSILNIIPYSVFLLY